MNEGYARAKRRADAEVFIFHESEKHPPQRARAAVAKFVRVDGRWHEIALRRSSPSGYAGAARLIVGDELPEPGWAAVHDSEDGAQVRERYELACRLRRCASSRVVLRAESLWSVLDKIAAAGIEEIPLEALNAVSGR